MILHAHETWEIKNDALAAFVPTGIRSYSMVEMALNVPIFLTELQLLDDEDARFWRTFFLMDFDKVLSLISIENALNHSISILLPVRENTQREYSVSTLVEAFDARSNDGRNRTRVFVCANGTRFAEWNFGTPETELILMRQIYKKDP